MCCNGDSEWRGDVSERCELYKTTECPPGLNHEICDNDEFGHDPVVCARCWEEHKGRSE